MANASTRYMFSIAKMIVQPSNSSQPVEIGTLQQVKIDISIAIKDLRGQLAFPILGAQGEGTVKGSANAARFDSRTIGALLNGTYTTGAGVLLANESFTVPASPYTVTPANAAKFVSDGGCILTGTSALFSTPMTKVTGTPSNSGEYAVNTNTGIYTFALADKGSVVKIDYAYSATTGSTLTVPNFSMGETYPFSILAKTSLQGKQVTFKFPNAVSGKFALDFKIGEWAVPNFDFECYADGQDNIFYIYED